MMRAKGAVPAVEFIDRAMSWSRETVRPVCGSDGDRSRVANEPGNDDKGCAEKPESRRPTLPNLEGYVRSRARGLASRPWRRHISRIERRRGPVGRYGESAAAVLVFEALFALRGLAGGDRRAVRRRSGGDLGALWRRGSEVVAAEAGQKGAAMARSVSAGGSAAWRWRAIEVEPRLAIMMCHSGRRQPAIGRPGRCAA
jgi:hypothetical protein